MADMPERQKYSLFGFFSGCWAVVLLNCRFSWCFGDLELWTSGTVGQGVDGQNPAWLPVFPHRRSRHTTKCVGLCTNLCINRRFLYEAPSQMVPTYFNLGYR